MGGRSFGVTLDDTQNKVKDLKCAVEEQEGFAVWTQQLFRFGGGGGGDGGSAAPLLDSVAVCDEERFALCVDSTLGKFSLDRGVCSFLLLVFFRNRRMGRFIAFGFGRHEGV